MTTELLTVRGDWSIDTVADFFVEHGISGAPVLDDEDKLIGVVSVSDIAAHAADGSQRQDRNEQDQNVYFTGPIDTRLSNEDLRSMRVQTSKETSAKDIMTSAVFSVEEDASVSDIAGTMIAGRIHRVVVAKANTVVGIITSIDMLKLLVEE